MYNEIDLHQMNFDDALRVFITKYNSLYKKGERREIMVIHGYGSKSSNKNKNKRVFFEK